MKRRVFLASGYFGDFVLYLVYISCLGQCGVFGLYPAGQFVSAGCDKSGEILCTGYPDARSDHVSGAHHQCETIWL